MWDDFGIYINHNPRFSVSPRPRVSLNHPLIQQRPLNYGPAAPLDEQTISRLQAQGIAGDRIFIKANMLQTKS
ncbi:hypothetical protein I8752_01440 [Nostocaceae cyanobacterium CENA369]|uniref:Uncharacterized protein n=1 Tax=Dendronalium phyllosphericum CENA369 TaxID=1725256 RepID=A0A8J7HWZ0_9NOST|nr:hypothetical protein [Dendronalium phyllosphericum]MBH8571711.1 hypothetical protein [Dendronalium phyllosphericum CENA369]